MSEGTRTSMMARLKGRIQHGLLAQEVLDGLHRRFRIIVEPYYLVAEGLQPGALPPEQRVACDVRFLTPADMPQVAAIRTQPRTVSALEVLLLRSRCLGIFVDGRLAGYTWSREDEVPIPTTGRTLFTLGPGEAYLFDAFVAREFRGHQLAPVVRHHLYRKLAELGRTRLYSITLAFNRSSRRFKEKLGAREVELRVVLGIAGWRAWDVRLRSLQNEIRTPRFAYVRPLASASGELQGQ